MTEPRQEPFAVDAQSQNQDQATVIEVDRNADDLLDVPLSRLSELLKVDDDGSTYRGVTFHKRGTPDRLDLYVSWKEFADRDQAAGGTEEFWQRMDIDFINFPVGPEKILKKFAVGVDKAVLRFPRESLETVDLPLSRLRELLEADDDGSTYSAIKVHKSGTPDRPDLYVSWKRLAERDEAASGIGVFWQRMDIDKNTTPAPCRVTPVVIFYTRVRVLACHYLFFLRALSTFSSSGVIHRK